MTSEPLLRVDGLSIRHESDAPATPSNVSFRIDRGDVVLLLGPSGCGKSTLTLAVNGLIPHDVPAHLDGAVNVAGMDTADTTVADLSRHVAMVFQDPDAQLVTGTVFDEVAFGPENLLVPADDVAARVESALRRVGLWDRRAWNPDRLSGGGRQRLAIACALAMGSPLLVLDEPTANLDPQGVEDVYASLADVVAAGDRAVLLVEHNLDEAVGLVNRVIVLDAAGRVFRDGDVDLLRRDAQALADLGVWLPAATLAGLALRAAGVVVEPLPLTAAELRTVALPTLAPRTATPERVAAEPAVTVRGLHVVKRGHRILHDVDLDIARGSFTAVVGPNGAGKTTLVQALAGVTPPPRGTVRIGDLDPGRASARDLAAGVGFVFQNPEHQFIAYTVADELAHGLRIRRTPPDEVARRVDKMLERFALADRRDVHPFLLSGGQKRRLSVGTALIAGAPVLVLDEPTFGQDRARAAELLDILSTLRDDGVTVIVVTHDMQLVAEYATDVVVVADGTVRASGPTREVFADETLLAAVGLRLPPMQRAFRDTPGLEHVWDLSDLTQAVRA